MTTNIELNKKLQNLSGFVGVFPCNLIPEINQLPASLIINTKPLYDEGEHWVALYINQDKVGTYFDSYGLKPVVKDILDYINKECVNGWTYNQIPVQGIYSITCGEYCAVFLTLKTYEISLFDIIKLFTTNPKVNDVIVKNIYKKI